MIDFAFEKRKNFPFNPIKGEKPMFRVGVKSGLSQQGKNTLQM
jgi:hypothetical protein